MARASLTKLYTRIVNSFSAPVAGTTISPTDAEDLFDDIETALNAVGTSQTETGAIVSGTDFGYPYNRIQILSDGVDVSGLPVGKDVATGLLLEMYPKGAAKGSRNGATFACWVPTGSTVNTGANYGYCGLLQYGATDINLGGTNTGAGARGAVFGGNSFARAGASATNLYGAVGHESDVLLAAGSTTKIRAGYSAVDFGSGAATQGATYDAAYSVGALAGSVKWKTGYLISDVNGGDPIDVTVGKLFATQGAATVNYGVDISSYTFTTGAFKSNGFLVDGSGNVTAAKVNKVTVTAPATGSTLTIADGKTLTVSNTATLSGNDSSTLAFGGGGTIAYQAGLLISNGTLAVTAGSSALTITLNDSAGNTPSASTPVHFNFRSATGTTGTTSLVSVTASTTLVISSGSTLGVTSSQAFRLWVVGFNDAGTFRLGVINCSTSTQIYSLMEGIPASSTAEGGAGAADSAGVFYTGTAVTSKAYRILGYIEWSSSGLTAGTWTTSNLLYVQPFGPGIKKPGDVIQTIHLTGVSQTATTSSTFQSTTITQAITPTSAANLIRADWTGGAATASNVTTLLAQMHRGSTAIGIAYTWSLLNGSGQFGGLNFDLPNSNASTTYVIKIKSTDNTTNVIFPYTGVGGSGAMILSEIMG